MVLFGLDGLDAATNHMCQNYYEWQMRDDKVRTYWNSVRLKNTVNKINDETVICVDGSEVLPESVWDAYTFGRHLKYFTYLLERQSNQAGFLEKILFDWTDSLLKNSGI
jgi:hypothetical protein